MSTTINFNSSSSSNWQYNSEGWKRRKLLALPLFVGNLFCKAPYHLVAGPVPKASQDSRRAAGWLITIFNDHAGASIRHPQRRQKELVIVENEKNNLEFIRQNELGLLNGKITEMSTYEIYSHFPRHQSTPEAKRKFALLDRSDVAKAAAKGALDKWLTTLVSVEQMISWDFSSINQETIQFVFPRFDLDALTEQNRNNVSRLRQPIDDEGKYILVRKFGVRCELPQEKLKDLSEYNRHQNMIRMSCLTPKQRNDLRNKLPPENLKLLESIEKLKTDVSDEI